MNKITIGKYERVSKQAARRLFNKGFNITIAPCNCFPGHSWGIAFTTNCYEYSFGDKGYSRTMFDKLTDNFTYYNCNSELGRYPAYYVDTQKVNIHCEFTDGKTPVIYRDTPAELVKKVISLEKSYYIRSDKQYYLRLTEV